MGLTDSILFREKMLFAKQLKSVTRFLDFFATNKFAVSILTLAEERKKINGFY